MPSDKISLIEIYFRVIGSGFCLFISLCVIADFFNVKEDKMGTYNHRRWISYFKT